MPATLSTARHTLQPGCLRSTSPYSYDAASQIGLAVLSAFAGAGAPPVLLVDGYNICGSEEGAAADLPLKVRTNKQHRVIHRIVHPGVFSFVSDRSFVSCRFMSHVNFLSHNRPSRWELFGAGDLEGAQRRLVAELDNLAHHKGYRAGGLTPMSNLALPD